MSQKQLTRSVKETNRKMDSDDDMLPSSQQQFIDELPFNSSSDDDLLSSCEVMEKSLGSKPGEVLSTSPRIRFAPPKTDEEISSMSETSIPTRSRAAMKWACKAFEDWRQSRNERIMKGNTSGQKLSLISNALLDLNDDELNYSLCRFVCEVRKENGENYPPGTVRHLLLMIQKHLNQNKRPVALMTDAVFIELRNTLDRVMKDGANKGLGIHHRQAKVISTEQEHIMWEKGLVGNTNPDVLLNTIIYSIGLNFALRSGDEHMNLLVDQFEVGSNDHGRFLKYTENITKCNQRGFKDFNIPPKRVYAYASGNGKCVVSLFEKYMSLRPPNAPPAMYLRPLKNRQPEVWYSLSLVGKHTLAKTVGNLCKAAGFEGFFSNHSLRATCATQMFQHGMDEQLTAETTGHRSDSVRSYKRVSDQQDRDRSRVIQGTASKVPRVDAEDVTQQRTIDVPLATAGDKLQFSCTFNINLKK